jgi:putative transposon-encoded protein
MSIDKTKTVKEVIDTVKPISNGAHVYLPKDWIGKKVRVTLI